MNELPNPLSAKTWPRLFKRTSLGATQQWSIQVIPMEDQAVIRTHYGQVGGAIQVADVHVRQGKNIGKANATTPLKQALLEGESRWKKQKDKGYGESVAVEQPQRKPMLAQDYAKYKDQVKWPAQIQPKLDGIRCLAHMCDGEVTLMSRGNKPIDTMGHIVDDLLSVMGEGETWDGELYSHGHSFQDLVSWVKRDQPNSRLVQYHVYDAIAEGPFAERFHPVRSSIENVKGCLSPMVVPTREVSSHEEVRAAHDEFVRDGYEGAMVRHDGCPYKEGYRSRALLKVKAFLEQEFEIVGTSEGKGKFEGMAIFRLVTDQGVEFDCMPRGTDTQRRAYWERRSECLGQSLTVRFFEWTTSDPPCPRFPVGLVIRDYQIQGG